MSLSESYCYAFIALVFYEESDSIPSPALLDLTLRNNIRSQRATYNIRVESFWTKIINKARGIPRVGHEGSFKTLPALTKS